MQITEIRFKMGVTQNLGDYSNCRPELELAMSLDENDQAEQWIDSLVATARTTIHEIVDDELEAAGREPKYYKGPLYCVAYNDARRCIVIYNSEDTPPVESTWRDSDMWRRQHSAPSKMRPRTAVAVAREMAIRKGYLTYDIEGGDWSSLPPLPEAGIQPTWHKKGLQSRLERLQLPTEHWEEVAALEHVDARYLDLLYGRNLEQEPLEVRLETIRARMEKPFRASEDDGEEFDGDDYEDDDGEDEEDIEF